jgi:hypothetical protein
MTIALVLFGVAAAGGLLLALMRFTNKPLPLPLALVHGALAAAGLVLLAVAAFGAGGTGQTRLAFGLFVLAALGGFTLFSFHMRKRALPIPIVVVHGLVAVAAFLILLGTVISFR